MDIGECGVCGLWASGTRLPSGNRRGDGTTPMDNFVCYRCREARARQRVSSSKRTSASKSLEHLWKRDPLTGQGTSCLVLQPVDFLLSYFAPERTC
jgi:hypothetical protein